MTTAQSPLRILKAQADKIAKALKAAERGEELFADPFSKIAAARREKDNISFAVAMDDKILKIEIPWDLIRDTSESGISEYILKHMRDQRDMTQ